MKRTIIFVVAILIALILILTGCEQVGKVPSENKIKKQSSGDIKSENQEKEEATDSLSKAESTGTLSLSLYFANEQGDKLIKVMRLVPATNEVARAALEQLISGPTEPGHFATIPKNTRLLDISIRDEVASVDFSEEFIKNAPGGSASEIMTVFSIVNTLTEFPTVESVQFLVNGKKIDTISGHYDLSEPVKRDKSLVVLQ